MKIILLCTFFYSTTLVAQFQNKPYKIDTDYNFYLKKVFKPVFNKTAPKSKEIPDYLIFGKLNKAEKLLKITDNSSFSIDTKEQNNIFLAAVLFGIKHFATFEFVSDDYEQLSDSKDIVMKEFLKIKVHIIPDTSTMELIKSIDINKVETVNQFKHKKLIKLIKPIIVTYYSNHVENNNRMNNMTKILIRHENNTIYSSIQNRGNVSLNHNTGMNDKKFIYKYGKLNKLVSGGLMHLTLNNLLLKVKNHIHTKALNLSSISDIYKNQNKDLKRIYDRGKLSVVGKSSKDLLMF